MKIVRIFAVLAVAFVTTAALAQTNSKKMSATNVIEAKVLYNAFKQGKAEQYKKTSVELSETKDASGRVLCVLPFSDYLKLRKVSKKDRVVMEGNVLGFSDEHDIVVVKQCKIIEVNGKKQ